MPSLLTRLFESKEERAKRLARKSTTAPAQKDPIKVAPVKKQAPPSLGNTMDKIKRRRKMLEEI